MTAMRNTTGGRSIQAGALSAAYYLQRTAKAVFSANAEIQERGCTNLRRPLDSRIRGKDAGGPRCNLVVFGGRKGHNSGFTLTEVLVGTMLLTIVMTAVYTLFFGVISTWRSEENDEGLHRKARAVVDVMAVEYANLHAGGSQLFEGSNDEFTMFVLTQPMDVASGEGRHLMRIRYRYDRANQQLEREEALVEGALPPVVHTAGDFDRGRIELSDEATFVVATNVTNFEVRYLWVERPGPEYWNRKPVPVEPKVASRHRVGLGLPQAIEIDLSLQGARDGAQSLSVTRRLTTRTFTRQRDAWELSRMLEDLE